VKCKGLLGDKGEGDVGILRSPATGIDFDRVNGVAPDPAVGEVTGGVKA
jgi:hypothetical protein